LRGHGLRIGGVAVPQAGLTETLVEHQSALVGQRQLTTRVTLLGYVLFDQGQQRVERARAQGSRFEGRKGKRVSHDEILIQQRGGVEFIMADTVFAPGLSPVAQEIGSMWVQTLVANEGIDKMLPFAHNSPEGPDPCFMTTETDYP
jgi:hypothetical protein